MLSERIQRRINRFLDDAEAAANDGAWPTVAEKARAVLAMDSDNEDARALLRAAEVRLGHAEKRQRVGVLGFDRECGPRRLADRRPIKLTRGLFGAVRNVGG